jgi:hypothetical protein
VATGSLIYIPGDSIAIVVDGKHSYHASWTHRNFDAIVEAAKAKQWDKIAGLVDVGTAITSFGRGLVQVVDGEVLVNGNVVHSTLTERIITMIDEGFDVAPFVLFYENLLSNPSKRSIDELYGFLEVSNLPITEDGHFLAYKKVQSNYLDIHSGTFDNSVGATCSMLRDQVDDDKERTCSHGLHFCSKEYLNKFGNTTSRVMIVKINPRDVVSIPIDYNNAKGRCCEYLVIGEVENSNCVDVFTQSVYDTNSLAQQSSSPSSADYGRDQKDYNFGYTAGRKKEQYSENSVTEFFLEGYKDGRAHKSRYVSFTGMYDN